MKRLFRSWVFWLFVVPAVALPFLCSLRIEEFGIGCPCGSSRIESSVRFDVADQVVYRGKRRVERAIESDLSRDVLQEAHVHRDALEKQIFKSAKGESFVAAGPDDLRRTFSDVCVEAPAFLVWLTARRRAGMLTAQAVEVELSKNLDYPEGRFPLGWTPP